MRPWLHPRRGLSLGSCPPSGAATVRSPCPGGWVVAGTSGHELLLGMANTLAAIPRTAVDHAASYTDGVTYNSGDIEPALLKGLNAAGLLERST